jgi:uncharacterized protein
VHYLIDGYNLLHQVGLLSGQVGPTGLEKARRALLVHLSQCLDPVSDTITVVFDALRAPPGLKDTLSYRGIRVRFTRDEEADDLIEELIRRASMPQRLTVVSNDRRIRDAARRRSCAVAECVEFWDQIARQPWPAPGPGTEEEGRQTRVGRDELEAWAAEFAGLDDDPDFKELFNPYDFDDPASE